ncbi:hypothetical protein FWJ25_06860 [Marinobacter salinexigens]|uniref:Uncharacterized protein n=1 Tax=Marinobacter salinexigens TaxID=2919747 RepID=A0A5B0VK95_9GAMM|nr:hypothetical protein [Marinobacter salinexigens]KAA1175082.1 hypothetical protein FWJ25_06860 [Marinobacter salinexigens]
MRISPFYSLVAAAVFGSFGSQAGAANEGSSQVSREVREVRLSVEGISRSMGEDEPRVLYILPWQAPSLPRRPRADLNVSAPNLEQALDPRAIERHRLFRETLNPLTLRPVGAQSPM